MDSDYTCLGYLDFYSIVYVSNAIRCVQIDAVSHVIPSPVQPATTPGKARTPLASPAIGSFATTARGYPHRYRTPYTSPTHRTAIMNAFRVARAARPAFNAFRTVQRRGYADVAADKILLSLALPHQVRLETWKWRGNLRGLGRRMAGERRRIR